MFITDPRTGQVTWVPDDSPAAQLNTQLSQPVTGPRGVVPTLGSPAPAKAPTLGPQGLGPRGGVAPQSPALDPFAQYAGQGGVNQPGAAPMISLPGDGPRGGGASVSVPTMSSLIPEFDFAQPQVAAPVAPAAGLPNPTPPVPQPQLLDAEALAPANAQIAQSLASLRQPQPAAPTLPRGVYDQTNTPRGTGAPANNGINFGFGVNGSPTARQVLDNFAAQDQQSRLNQRAKMADLNQASLASQINDPFTDTVQKRALLKLYEINERGRDGQAAGLAAQSATTSAQTAAQTRNAQLQAQSQQQQAQLTAQSRLDQTKLAGEYGLQEAGLRASAATQAASLKNQSGENRAALANAALAETRLAAIQAGVQTGVLNPISGVIDATRNGQEPRPQLAIDPLTGIPYTPEEIAFAQQQRAREAQARATRN